ERGVIGNTKARYEVRVSLTGYKTVIHSGRELVSKLPEKRFFMAIVKSNGVSEAADRGARPGFQRSFTVAKLDSRLRFRKVLGDSVIHGMPTDGYFRIGGYRLQLRYGYSIAAVACG